MASGDSDGESGRIKRYREPGDCTDDDDGGRIGRNKIRRVVADSSGHDGESSKGTGDHIEGDTYGDLPKEIVDEGDGSDDTGDEYMFDDIDDDGYATATSAPEHVEKRYIVLTEDDIRARQEADTAKVAEVLSVPSGFAAVLLRHFKWMPRIVQEEWFSDDRHVRDAVGLQAEGSVPVALSKDQCVVCAICFDGYSAGQKISAGCPHYYCRACWRGYIHAAVDDGHRCLSLRCPDPDCSAAVVRELVDAVATGTDRDWYGRFALRSYVEDSGGRVKWCPGPGCARAVEFSGCAGDAADVFCACGHGFCFRCGEEAHRPVSCDTVRAWLAKNISDAASANWVLANTKHCPKCRHPIEKNQGCNHMRCRCGHHFCWLCLRPAGDPNHYSCESYPQQLDKAGAGRRSETKEEKMKRQAKASLDRYLYHYERWVANYRSLQKALEDMDVLERSGLQDMAAAVGCQASDLAILTDAYKQIADGRRVLRWAHAYGYFLDPERDIKKRELFDYLQNEANNALERLHGCAELDRKELCANSGADITKEFKAYREKLANLTSVTKTYFENLMKAFETDLPEVYTMNF